MSGLRIRVERALAPAVGWCVLGFNGEVITDRPTWLEAYQAATELARSARAA